MTTRGKNFAPAYKELHTKVAYILDKKDKGELRSSSALINKFRKVIDVYWEELTPTDFLVLLSRRDFPAKFNLWLRDTFIVFYSDHLRNHDKIVILAEKTARAIRIPKGYEEDIRSLSLGRVQVKSTSQLKNCGDNIERIQASRDRVVSLLSYIDVASSPLQDAVEEATFHLVNLSIVGTLFSTEKQRAAFAAQTLRYCTRRSLRIKRLQKLGERVLKNLDNAYFSIKLAVDALSERNYRTGFKGPL